jgi:hypothetical protein
MSQRDQGCRLRLLSGSAGRILGVILVLVPAAFGAEPGEKKMSDGRWAEMERQARALKVVERGKRGSEPAELIAEPLLRYNDSARSVRVGTLWAWGRLGRPVAALEVEDYPKRPTESRWLNNMVSLSSNKLDVDWPVGPRWSSTEAGFELRQVPNAPVPAEKDSVRLIQMRRLADRFEAHEQAGATRGDRLQLRLMSRPLHRYADLESGLRDGAIFCFAYGTNPEVLLFVESRSGPTSVARWEYGLARMSGGELFVNLDGREVWKTSEANPPVASSTCTARFVPPTQETQELPQPGSASATPKPERP